jgi:hydroxypyruvate reductase
MMTLCELHRAAREIFAAALRSVDAFDAVRRAIKLQNSHLKIEKTTIDFPLKPTGAYAISIGKAAFPMAAALDEALGSNLIGGVVAGRAVVSPVHKKDALLPQRKVSARWKSFYGGHPLPNESSLLAAQASFALLDRANDEGALVIFLISGGGSALIEWPRDARITLEELRQANRALISCGASIAEINAVRRAFSAVKGGALAARAPFADQLSLIISDTNEDDEANVASGPTYSSQTNLLDVHDVIERYDLANHLPESVLRMIEQSSVTQNDLESERQRAHHVLSRNADALQAAAEAARARGFTVEIACDINEQSIIEGCAELLSHLDDLRRSDKPSSQQKFCLISGGEFACPVQGHGLGGRNAETILRLAIELDGQAKKSVSDDRQPPDHIVALSVGTDGIDGNSPAAGAIADETTLERARAINLTAQSFLKQSDAFTFFNALGDAVFTGPTGTNVRDLRIILTG